MSIDQLNNNSLCLPKNCNKHIWEGFLKVAAVAGLIFLAISAMAILGNYFPQLAMFTARFAMFGFEGQIVVGAISLCVLSASTIALCIKIKRVKRQIKPTPPELTVQTVSKEKKNHENNGFSLFEDSSQGLSIKAHVSFISSKDNEDVYFPEIFKTIDLKRPQGPVRSIPDSFQDSEELDSAKFGLFAYFQNLPDLNELDEVSFQEGQIVKESTSDATTNFIQLLKSTYGTSLVDKVIERYEEYGLQEGSSLTWDLVKKTLVGIAANVTTTDLRDLFHVIKNDDQSNELGCYHYLGKTVWEHISEKESFEDLSANEIHLLENAFRTLPINGRMRPVLDVLYGAKSEGLGVLTFDNFSHDAEFLRLLDNYFQFDPDNLALAVAEYISKNLSYLELKEGMFFHYVDGNGKKIYYKVEAELPDQDDGIVCNFFTPLNDKQLDEDESVVAHLNFRGTQAQPAQKGSGASLKRDLDYTGVGKSSFLARKDDLLNMVSTYLSSVKEEGRQVVLKINGHSLGGVDVQRATTEILKDMAEDIPEYDWGNLSAIEACTHNSPAIEATANNEFQTALTKLENTLSNFIVDLTFVCFNSDPVQKVGSIFLSAGITSPLLKKRVIFLTSDQITFISQHGAMPFTDAENKKAFSMQIIDEKSLKLLEQILTKNYYWNPDKKSIMSRTGDYIFWYGSYLILPATTLIQAIVYAILSTIRGISYYTIGTRNKPGYFWRKTAKPIITPPYAKSADEGL